MKLRRLRMQNLASLEGEHEIDFTGPLGESPIFLVMGPTGAGKSTLLDAICLALFGVTPRLSKERGDGLETDPRLIMTRGTFECRAFVEFSKIEASGERRIYQAEWYCHRANKKPDGNLQPPRRSMGLVGPNGDVEPLLPSQRGADMAPVFRQVLEGVTVEDFKRSVLLAQGEFAAFLKADDGERGKILERLIHAEPFRALGKRVSQRRSEQDKLVHEWKGKVGATQLPTESEQAQLRADEALAREAQEAAQKALAQGEELGRRAAHAEHLARQLQESEAQVPVLEQSLAAANTQRAEALAQQQTRFTAAADLREKREALVPLVQQARQARLQEEKAKALVNEAQTAFTQAEQDRGRKGRLRDEVREKAAQVATRAAQCEATRAGLTPYQGLVEKLPAFEATTNHLRHFVRNAGLEKNDIAEAEALRETPDDERTLARDRARQEHEEALAGAPDAASRRQALLAQRNGLQTLLTELPLLAQALEQGALADKAVLESKTTLETAERARQDAEKLSETQTALARTLGEALQGVGDELKNLQWMMSLAEGRQHLHKEHPCPLCGSREHPALQEEGRQRLDDELLARKALLETRQKELTQQHTEAESQLRQCKAEEAAKKARWQTLHDHHRAAEAHAEGARAHVRRRAAPLHLADGISLQETQERLSQAKASEAQLRADLDRLEKTEALARRLERQEAALRYLAERAQLLVDLGQAGAPLEGPDTKSRVDGALQFAHAQREALQKATEALAQAQRDGAESAARQTAAEAAFQEASAAYERESLRRQQAQTLWEEARALAAPLLGGRDPDTVEEEQRRAEHLANEQLQTTTNALGQASQKVTALEARLEEIRQKASTLRQEVAQALQFMHPAREAGLLDAHERWDPARLEERRQAYAEATRVWGALGEKVAALDAAKSKALAFQKELAAAQEALDLWKRLHELVGTKDGEDFKNFALSLELQCLLEQANHRLARLAPRYRLEQATDKDGNPRLAFAIADAFQADQERPLSTLSGGETFLVSLALALALADYRALRMPMETLLIDEGFGTLDPDTLNVAMGALEALHASGVQVGVISHVEALKERIFARIAVRPDRPGRSRIHTELVGT